MVTERDPEEGLGPSDLMTRDENTPDWSKDSPEDDASGAPTGKEETTETDEELSEDQLTIQTDSS